MTNERPREIKNGTMHRFLADPATPMEQRLRMLRHACAQDTPDVLAVLTWVLDGCTAQRANDLLEAKLHEVDEALAALKSSPLRTAHYLQQLDRQCFGPRALVVLSDGSITTCSVADPQVFASLACGTAVLIDAKNHVLLGRAPEMLAVGEEACFERDLGDGRIEATMGSDERRLVYRTANSLAEMIAQKRVEPGARVLVCPVRLIAFSPVPAIDRMTRYSFVSREAVPDVRLERDIGDPHPFVAETLAHVRTELTAPEVARRYGLRRSRMMLLVGVSGSGKTLHIQALQRELYELMAATTGLPIDQLPPRVVRLRSSDLLSKWFGESEQRIARAFDEIEALAAEPVPDARGLPRELPVLVVIEEADGLGRQRGSASSDVHDRVQTTLLQRLDTTTQKLRDRLVVFVFSTNVPQLMDAAFLRRAGGQTIRFGRLGRRSFSAVLDKCTARLPFAAGDGGEALVRETALERVTAWMFAPDAEAVVELHAVGSATPTRRHARDFLTGALVDRAVQEAAARAARNEAEGRNATGLDAQQLMTALWSQIQATVDQLRPENVADHVNLPDGVRIASVRRIPTPLPVQSLLERAG
ncbi:MAG TPA: ATP-binding protein [Planctomycetota bacterium]